MSNVAFYLHKKSDSLLGPAQVRRMVGELHTDIDGKNRKDFAPRDPSLWSEEALAHHGIYPVYATDPPEVDDRLQTKDGRGAVWDGDRYVQAWNVTDKFPDETALKTHLLGELERIAEQKRSGGITVNGVPVRTDPVGIARITGAKLSGRSQRKFPVGAGEYVVLDQSDIDEIFSAVDLHIERVDDRHAELMDAVKASSDPINVDLHEGWPE